MLFNMYQNVKPRSLFLISHLFYLNAKTFDGCRYWSNLHNCKSQITDFQDGKKSKSVPRPRCFSLKIEWKKMGQKLFNEILFIYLLVYFRLIFMFLIIRPFNNLMWRTFDWLHNCCLTQTLAVYQLYRGVSKNNLFPQLQDYSYKKNIFVHKTNGVEHLMKCDNQNV